MKTRVATAIRRTLISIAVLIVLAALGGAAYVWYSGQQGPAVATDQAAVPVVTAPVSHAPTKQTPDAVMSASVQSLSSPVSPGENATITVKTNSNATCVISVIYDKTSSKDSGLSKKVADDYGMVSWTWTVDATAPIGKWPVKVVCTNVKNSSVVQADLVVAKT